MRTNVSCHIRIKRRWPMCWCTPVLILLSGCGYVMAGTWEDDPGNWSRAFHSTMPTNVTVTHSKYWRSPHWSYESGYFFEVAANPALKEHLLTRNKLRLVAGDEAAAIKQDIVSEHAPSWFAPNGAIDYEVWVDDGESEDHFKILIDKKTGAIF